MKLVSLHHVSVSYDKVPVLTDVDLDIRNDDFIGVIGPNGGGKTTLVKAILKAVPYSGEVIYAPEIENRGCRRIGYLPQISEIDKSFPISVREVVLSGLQARKRLFGRYTAEDRQKPTNCCTPAGSKRSPGNRSGLCPAGQIQRTLLCRALISDPELLILDEPTNFVDNQFEKELYLLLKRFNEKMAIVMVSHDLGTISSYVRSIVCVNRRVHRHDSNIITAEQLHNYNCPIQIVSHGDVPHTVLAKTRTRGHKKSVRQPGRRINTGRLQNGLKFLLFTDIAQLPEQGIDAGHHIPAHLRVMFLHQTFILFIGRMIGPLDHLCYGNRPPPR